MISNVIEVMIQFRHLTSDHFWFGASATNFFFYSQSPEVLWKGWTKNLPQSPSSSSSLAERPEAPAMADNDMVDEAEAPVLAPSSSSSSSLDERQQAAPSSSSSSSLDERPAAPETADNDMADEAPVAPETADNDMADEAPVAPETADNDMADEADTAERAREVQSPVETIAYPDSDDDHFVDLAARRDSLTPDQPGGRGLDVATGWRDDDAYLRQAAAVDCITKGKSKMKTC
eukprot:g75382.t1